MKLFKNRIVLVLFLLSISLGCFGQNGSRYNSLQPVIIKSSSGISADIDSVTGAMEVIDSAHHEIHSGSHFYLQG